MDETPPKEAAPVPTSTNIFALKRVAPAAVAGTAKRPRTIGPRHIVEPQRPPSSLELPQSTPQSHGLPPLSVPPQRRRGGHAAADAVANIINNGVASERAAHLEKASGIFKESAVLPATKLTDVLERNDPSKLRHYFQGKVDKEEKARSEKRTAARAEIEATIPAIVPDCSRPGENH